VFVGCFFQVMTKQANQPIGLFDSGVGGLTVANALRTVLPNENLIYFGDTFHLPYGDKSKESVNFYAQRISEFLLSNHCKVILIACNTASAAAFETVQELVGNRAIVMDVINPVIQFLSDTNKYKRIGVIGTKGTINSGCYQRKLISVHPAVKVTAMATPLLVPMIEEGFIYDDISNAIIRSYLSRDDFNHIDALILGCTHYPLIKNQISRFFNFTVDVIDSGMIVANALRNILTEQQLLNNTKGNNHIFYVSDYTDYFATIARIFFEQDVKLQKLDFWK